ncbi:MAG: FHA domain-containing protein [Myxococcales bacterium]|nr:FHA domain-containing protein [Myxococcales bacterium]
MGELVTQPFDVSDLAAEVRSSGADLTAILGPFVLIGDGRQEPSRAFLFLTTEATPFGGAEPSPFADSVVFGLRKRTARFGDVVLVGRADSNDVTIQHTSISKLHARLRDFDEDGFTVEDAGSRNGTFLNQARVLAPTRVSCGDVLCFGRRAFRVRRTDRLVKALGVHR